MSRFFLVLCGLLLAGCEVPKHPVRDLHLEDIGPDHISYRELQAYPEEMQTHYVLFAKRCSKCHTPARPLNSRIASRKTWARYVTSMKRRAGSNISRKEARQIIDFLVFDSKIRKVDRPELWKAHRQRLINQFKKREPELYEQGYAGQEDVLLQLQ